MDDFNLVINTVLLAFMAATALATIQQRDLLAVVVLAGIFSFLSAAFLLVQDAVDVSFTEAAVGAGISMVLMLATLALTGNEREKPTHHRRGLALFAVLVTGVALVYGTWDMPAYGDPAAPIHTYTTPRYLQDSGHEIGIPNVVTSVLASYRAYDTLGETTVILTAGVGVILLLGFRRFPRRSLKDNS